MSLSILFWRSAVRLSFSFQADRVREMRESWSWSDNLIWWLAEMRVQSLPRLVAGSVSQCTAAGWRRPPAVSFSGIIVCDWWLVLQKGPSEVSSSRRRTILGPFPGWKPLLLLSHLRHYKDTMLNTMLSTWNWVRDAIINYHEGRAAIRHFANQLTI